MAELTIRYYPSYEESEVRQTLARMTQDPNRRSAVPRLEMDMLTLAQNYPNTMNVDVRALKGWEPLREIRRRHNGIDYRVLFATQTKELWLLSIFEKKSDRAPRGELEKAYARLRKLPREGR